MFAGCVLPSQREQRLLSPKQRVSILEHSYKKADKEKDKNKDGVILYKTESKNILEKKIK